MDEVQRRLAHIHIRSSECKGCRYCVEICPKGVYEMTTVYNELGYRVPRPIHEEECIVCRRCEMACPELAIYVERVGVGLNRRNLSSVEARYHQRRGDDAIAHTFHRCGEMHRL